MRYNERIKEHRKKLRYTQRQLADKINVSPQVISNWERGYTEPSPEDIKKLSSVLDVSSDYLLGLSDEPEKTTYRNNFQGELLPPNKTLDEHIDDIIDEIIEEQKLEINPRKREITKNITLKASQLSKEDFNILNQLLDSLLEKQRKDNQEK
ncbi:MULTISPECIES: helix-turn-helix domain-containing protein [unclassified Lysinibacillus]|uniref:helix-turn-helix domain-containing protein n=1 Tax=unclassified Lysinibacillus TaxID=2636778 RepID=UPI00382D9054